MVHWEQGFGDVIQMCRYISLLKTAGARVLFLPQQQLQTLMRGLNAYVSIVGHVSVIPQFIDLQCPIMSLPLAFKTDIGSIPSASYISADKGKVAVGRIGSEAKPSPELA